MVILDGKKVKIFNGRELSSYIRFKVKEIARLSKLLSKCKKYFKRWEKLNKAKKELLNKTTTKKNDVLEKIYITFDRVLFERRN